MNKHKINLLLFVISVLPIFSDCTLFRTNNKIVFDISKLVKDSLVGFQHEKAQIGLKTFIYHLLAGSDDPMIYYEADLSPGLINETKNVLRIFQNAREKTRRPKFVFSLRDFDGPKESFNLTEYVHRNLSKVINLFLDNEYLVAGVSYHPVWIENGCHRYEKEFLSMDYNSSVLIEIREYIDTSNKLKNNKHESELQLGYKFHVNNSICNFHQINIQDADFLIMQIAVNPSLKSYVLTYDSFQSLLDKEVLSFASRVSEDKPVFITTPILAHLPNVPSESFCSDNIYQNSNDAVDQNWLTVKTHDLNTVKDVSYSSYECLLTNFIHEWITKNQYTNISMILSFLYGYPCATGSIFEGNYDFENVIPYITNYLSWKATGQDLRFQGTITIQHILKRVMLDNFKTVMLSAEIWNSIRNWNILMPSDVTYLVEIDERFNYSSTNSTFFQRLSDKRIIFVAVSDSRTYRSPKFQDLQWNISVACQIRTQVFDELKSKRKWRNRAVCTAQNIYYLIKQSCKYLNNSAIIIISETISIGEIEENNNTLIFLTSKIIRILNVFLKARDLMYSEFPNLTVTLQFQILYKDRSSWSRDTTLYCIPYSKVLSNVYQAILIWSQLYKFPVILKQSNDDHDIYTPLTWKQLEGYPLNPVHLIMKNFPLFIRRSYFKFETFGQIRENVYPCLSKAMINSKTKPLDFNNTSVGTSFILDLRQYSPLNSQEVQVILILALSKFTAVEISLLSINHFLILQQTANFPEFKQNLKLNTALGKTIYLNLNFGCNQTVVNLLDSLVHSLQNAGLNVNAHSHNLECIANATSVNKFGLKMKNCLDLAKNLISNLTQNINYDLDEVSYIVCETENVFAYNKDNHKIQGYLDSHLYLKMLLQSFYPNLEKVYFRLKSMLLNEPVTEQIKDMVMFFTDVNNYAVNYNINYFIVPAFNPEYSNWETSFWNIKNYTDLTNLSVYREAQAVIFNVKPLIPRILKPVNYPININLLEITPINYGNQTIEHTLLGLRLWLFYTIVTVTIGICTVIILIVFRALHQRKLKTNVSQPQNIVLHNPYVGTESSSLATSQRSRQPETSKYEMSNDEIFINDGNILGKGQFGVVFRGKLISDGTSIAIKMFLDSGSNSGLKGMLNEIKLLCKLGNHPNVVRFIGYCTSEIESGVLRIVTELCEGGSLINFLRNTRQMGLSEDFSVETLLRFCSEIAQGMEYVNSKNIIHGDLAARNVLLDGDQTCKIGDFGLSRQLYEYAEYFKTSHEPLPWRWMAYESLCLREFSTNSDVWMFGVTMWEIFSLGVIPFPTFSWNQLFIDELHNGLRLSCPQLATSEMYTVMKACWNLDPTERPSFSEIVQQVDKLQSEVFYTNL